MKFAYYGFYSPGSNDGAHVHMWQVIGNLIAAGNEVMTWIPGNGEGERVLPRNRLRRWLALRSADVVYIRMDHHVPRFAAQLRGPLHFSLGHPVRVWEFNALPEAHHRIGCDEQKAKEFEIEFRRNAGACDLAVCVSERLRDHVRDVYGIQNCVVIPNGSDPEMFHPECIPTHELSPYEAHFNVIWMGSPAAPWNDFLTMLDAARILIRSEGGKDIRFHLLGDFSDWNSNLPPNVVVHGRIPYPDLPKWLAGMNLGLVLYKEGPADFNSPLKLFDYMAAGLPVLTFPHPQASAVLKGEGVVERSPDALAAAILAAAADRDESRSVGRRLRRMVEDRYNWSGVAQATVAAITAVR